MLLLLKTSKQGAQTSLFCSLDSKVPYSGFAVCQMSVSFVFCTSGCAWCVPRRLSPRHHQPVRFECCRGGGRQLQSRTDPCVSCQACPRRGQGPRAMGAQLQDLGPVCGLPSQRMSSGDGMCFAELMDFPHWPLLLAAIRRAKSARSHARSAGHPTIGFCPSKLIAQSPNSWAGLCAWYVHMQVTLYPPLCFTLVNLRLPNVLPHCRRENCLTRLPV
jgi:hypothetical protein